MKTIPATADVVADRSLVGTALAEAYTAEVDGWLGSVTDLASGERVDIRELHAPPTQLGSLIVWSEVFAPCEGPSSTVRWSNMTAHTEDGASHHPPAVSLTYQSHGDGGCTNTNTAVVDGGVEQTTATIRRNHHGETLHL